MVFLESCCVGCTSPESWSVAGWRKVHTCATYRNHSVVPWLCHLPLLVDRSELCFFVGFRNEQFEESSNVRK